MLVTELKQATKFIKSYQLQSSHLTTSHTMKENDSMKTIEKQNAKTLSEKLAPACVFLIFVCILTVVFLKQMGIIQ